MAKTISTFGGIAFMLILKVSGVIPNLFCGKLGDECNPRLQNPCCDESKCHWLNSVSRFHCVAKAKLGDSCDSNQDCDDVLHSTCSSGVCVCRKNHIRVNSTNCTPLLGEFCWKEACAPENSICDDNECKCNEGFIPASNNFCSPMFLGSSCDSDDNCKAIKFSKCSSEACVCTENTIQISSISCSLLLGEDCASNSECGIAHSECIDNKCQCKSHYISYSNIECKLSYIGMPCTTFSDCERDLRPLDCIDNACECNIHSPLIDRNSCLMPLRQKCLRHSDCHNDDFVCIADSCQCSAHYISLGSQCLPRFLGGSCRTNDDCFEIPSAVCLKGQCTCDDKFVVLNRTMCVKSLGNPCFSSEDCIIKNSYCFESHCKCIDSYIQNAQVQCLPTHLQGFCSTDYDCRAIRNARCSRNNQCICKDKHVIRNDMSCAPLLNERCSNQNQCIVNNSVCKDNKCQCSDNYLERSNNQCVEKYLEIFCEIHQDCAQIPYTTCSDAGKCVCYPNYVRLEPIICLPLLGGHCRHDNDCVTEHSTCYQKQCRCSKGYSQRSQDLCSPDSLGQTCQDDEDCHEILNGKCSEDNICVCKSDYSESDRLVCLPLIGEHCKEHKECSVYNSNCVDNRCVCMENYIPQSNVQCLPRYIKAVCHSDFDCDDVTNSHCTRFNLCACKSNYFAVKGICAPILGARCAGNNTCATPNSQCVDQKCQCKPGFARGIYNDCLPKHLREFCISSYDCSEIIYSECIENECVCRNNYIAIDDKTCVPLLKGFCFTTKDCSVNYSVCIENKCQCDALYMAQAPNKCVPISLGGSCQKDVDCQMIQRATCSSDKICVCDSDTFFLDPMTCTPLLNSSCRSDECKIDSSDCIDKKCQCKDGYSAISASQCFKTSSLYSCLDSYDCVEPWHFDCSKEKKCICKENNIAVTNSTCQPTSGGVCWQDNQCMTKNSSCIDFHCRCSPEFLQVSNNFCVPKVNK